MLDDLHHELCDALAPFRDAGFDTSVIIAELDEYSISVSVAVDRFWLLRGSELWIEGLSFGDVCRIVFGRLWPSALIAMQLAGVPQRRCPFDLETSAPLLVSV